jgi:hypothetical protein
MKQKKPNSQLVGESGVHFVVSELTMRGMIAVPTTRNVKGPDVIVTNPGGTRFAAIQVKTRRNTSAKFWNVGDRGLTWGGPACYYVFVKWTEGKWEAWLEKASAVKRVAKADIEDIRRRRKKSFGAAWGFVGNKEREARTQRQWEKFRL